MVGRRENTRPAVEQKPPVGALIAEISNQAAVERDVMRVEAKVKIEVLAEGWNEIPLRLSDAAITGATIDGHPARIVGSPGEDYRLLIEKKDKKPESIELLLSYARSISRMPGQNSVSFQAPQAPVSRWRIVIPQAGVKVNLFPLIAATEVPGDGKADKKPDETVVLAFVGVAPLVRIDWTPKAEGATGMAALAGVRAEQQVWLGEGVVRTRTTLDYAISRAELGQLVIDVPADQKVVNVFDANVRQWAVEPVEGGQRITAQLFEPAKTSQRVTVELEKIVAEKAKNAVNVPMVKAVGVGRQQGVLVVQVAESLRAEAVKTVGLSQIDAGELPGAFRHVRWTLAYRYPTVPFELALDVEKTQPRIAVDSLVEARLQPERLTLDLTALYTIEKAGVFRVEWDIPAGFEVRQVRGATIRGATVRGAPPPLNAAPVEVDSHYLEGPKKTRLVVESFAQSDWAGGFGGAIGKRFARAGVGLAGRQAGAARTGDATARATHGGAVGRPAGRQRRKRCKSIPTRPPGCAASRLPRRSRVCLWCRRLACLVQPRRPHRKTWRRQVRRCQTSRGPCWPLPSPTNRPR